MTTVGPCEAEAIARGESERIQTDARRIHALEHRIDAVIQGLGSVVERFEDMRAEERTQWLADTRGAIRTLQE